MHCAQLPQKQGEGGSVKAAGAHLDALNLVEGHDACPALLHPIALILPVEAQADINTFIKGICTEGLILARGQFD